MCWRAKRLDWVMTISFAPIINVFRPLVCSCGLARTFWWCCCWRALLGQCCCCCCLVLVTWFLISLPGDVDIGAGPKMLLPPTADVPRTIFTRSPVVCRSPSPLEHTPLALVVLGQIHLQVVDPGAVAVQHPLLKKLVHCMLELWLWTQVHKRHWDHWAHSCQSAAVAEISWD